VDVEVQVAERVVSGPPLLVKVLAGVVSFGAGLALAVGAAGGLG
jgi:hypothetical protein